VAGRSPNKAGEPSGSVSAVVPLKEASIEVKVIRGPDSEYGPEGQVEDLGVVAYHSDNPLKQLLWELKNWRR